ncbi:DUF4817 domain-containing protein [Trichonephila clavipes]|nr:DUF4817 domain-containing protein [Trichonephila clavipes]
MRAGDGPYFEPWSSDVDDTSWHPILLTTTPHTARNFANTESTITVQWAFRIRFDCQPPNDNNILSWYHQFETTACLCKGKSMRRPRL